MRPTRKVLTATLLAAAVLGTGALPATAQTIPVTPDSPRPGQRVHVSVPGCGVGTVPHTVRSAAFTHDVTLYGKSDTGEGDPTIRKDAAPGAYPITAYCEKSTVHGQVVVTAEPAGGTAPSPAAHGGTGSTAAYWLLGAAATFMIAGAGAVLLFSRR